MGYMAITRYRAIKLRRDNPSEQDRRIPMFSLDQTEFELTLLRMKNGDQSVQETMEWINRAASTEHWSILGDVVVTKPETDPDVFLSFPNPASNPASKTSP